MGVRGTAGSTPAPASHKRESSIFSTPVVMRPPSALSDPPKDGAGKEKKTSETPSTVKTLAKSLRVNGPTASMVTKAVNRIEGSMGAPPLSTARKISGLAGTPSRQPSIHSRSASTNLSSSTSARKPVHQRRVSNLDPVTPVRPKTSLSSNGNRSGDSSPTLSEKENNRSLASVKTPMQKASAIKRTAVPA